MVIEIDLYEVTRSPITWFAVLFSAWVALMCFELIVRQWLQGESENMKDAGKKNS